MNEIARNTLKIIFNLSFLVLLFIFIYTAKTDSNITIDSQIDVNSNIDDVLEYGYITVDYEKEGKFFAIQPILKSFHTGRDLDASKTALSIFANYFRDEIIESMKNNDVKITQKEIERRIKIVEEENSRKIIRTSPNPETNQIQNNNQIQITDNPITNNEQINNQNPNEQDFDAGLQNYIPSDSKNKCPACGRELLGSPNECPYCKTKLK